VKTVPAADVKRLASCPLPAGNPESARTSARKTRGAIMTTHDPVPRPPREHEVGMLLRQARPARSLRDLRVPRATTRPALSYVLTRDCVS